MRKLKDKNVRKLNRIGGGSLYVTLPVELVEALGWHDNQKVVVQKQGRHLVIKDWKA